MSGCSSNVSIVPSPDILHVHDWVIKHFKERSIQSELLRAQADDADAMLARDGTDAISDNVREKLIEKRKTVASQLETCENDNAVFNFYMFYAMPLVERYRSLINTPVRVSFMSKPDPVLARQKEEEKSRVVSEYCHLLKRYQLATVDVIPAEYLGELMRIAASGSDDSSSTSERQLSISPPTSSSLTTGPTNVGAVSSSSTTCTGCGGAEFDVDGNLFTCVQCGIQLDLINASACIKDIDRVNISSKYTYDRRSHFKECIDQFQAKHNKNIPDKVFDDLYHQIKIHNLEDGDADTPPEIRYRRLSKEHIQIFLKELNYSKHYEDIVYIYHRITHRPADDISDIEAKLMEDFDMLTEKYDEKYKNVLNPLSGDGSGGNGKRKNFINIQCILYQLLLRHGYKCKRSDFNILKTVDKKYIHEDIIHDLFKELSWNFQNIS